MDASVFKTEWRNIFERHSASLTSDLSAHVHHMLDTAVHEVENRTRHITQRETVEHLNQALRRIRQSSTWKDALAPLADSTTGYCDRAAVFTLSETMADAVHTLGFDAGEIHVPLADAAAFRSAIDTKDPVTAIPSATEVSDSLAQILGLEGVNSVYLFPIAARQHVVALLLATGSVQPAALELLCHMVAMKSEATEIPSPGAPPALIQLEGEVASAPGPGPSKSGEQDLTAWERLTAEEQALHLQAQRFARVKVAEFRLYRAEAVREGRSRGDLYGQLTPEIDRARQGFYQNFITASSTMVDYFHLELLRSLAHEDNRLLGPAYPGPLI